jgi:hypothetical protein
MPLYQTKVWQLHLPDAWKVRDRCGQDLVIFFRPDGVGILTVLTADEPETTAGGGAVFRDLLPGKTREAKSGTSYSRSWTLACRGRRLYIRYSCAAHNSAAELSEVDEIVQSISESDDTVA